MLGLPGLATTSSEPPRSIQLIINSLPDLQKFNSGQKYFDAERKPKILWGKQRGQNKTLTHIVCVCVCVREKKLKTVTSSTNWKYQLNVPVAVEQFTCYALCDNFVFLGQVQSARGYAKHNSSHPQTTSVLLIVLRVAPGNPSPKSFFFTVKKSWELSSQIGARGPTRWSTVATRTKPSVCCLHVLPLSTRVLSRFSGSLPHSKYTCVSTKWKTRWRWLCD